MTSAYPRFLLYQGSQCNLALQRGGGMLTANLIREGARDQSPVIMLSAARFSWHTIFGLSQCMQMGMAKLIREASEPRPGSSPCEQRTTV
jgi:hypothetical protein